MLKNIIKKQIQYCANNYNSIPISFKQGIDIFLFDNNGKSYYDFLAGYGAVNQGHCHPYIVSAMQEQSKKLTLTSRACYNDKLADYSEKICKLFNYDKVLPTNTGVEAGETAIKMARAWGYMKKNIEKNNAKVVFANNNFWGRTIAAASSSSDPLAYNNYGPYTPGFIKVPYNNIDALRDVLANDKDICAIMLEPIQGEGGIIIPDNDYLIKVKELCKTFEVLLICDEVQTGLGRTGKLICSEHFDIKPDILLLGKALSGGLLPVSAVLSREDVIDCILPGSHGSTYGGNPLACVVASASLDVLQNENLTENALEIGKIFRDSIDVKKYSFIKEVRGMGLMNGMEFHDEKIAKKLCEKLLENKIFAKPTKENIIRFTPPLTISNQQMNNALDKIELSLRQI